MRVRFLASLKLLALLPFAGYSQERPAALIPTHSFEIGAGLSPTFDNQYGSFLGGMPRFYVNALRSVNRFQYGLTLEASSNSTERKYMMPGVLANYRIAGRNGYWYGGVMAAYVWMGRQGLLDADSRAIQGYCFGVQTGYVQRIYKGLSLNAELGFRNSQTWETFEDYIGNPPVHIYRYRAVNPVIYLPVSLGLRYRL